MAKNYTGEHITIAFDARRCIHARNCILKLPHVFDPDRKPWIDPDKASAEDIIAVIRTCPSGALTYHREGAPDEPAPGVNRMTIIENGPNAFHGNLVVAGEAMTRATICRCGATKNPPFCNNAHIDCGFDATGEPEPTGKDAPGDDPGEELTLIGHENGPLEAQGHLEITTGFGHRVHRGTRAFLCRCGHSKNKPFCDGSHKEAGFEMPGDGD